MESNDRKESIRTVSQDIEEKILGKMRTDPAFTWPLCDFKDIDSSRKIRDAINRLIKIGKIGVVKSYPRFYYLKKQEDAHGNVQMQGLQCAVQH